MILGPYRNPPYRSHRSPRQSSPSLSPSPSHDSPGHSPKRKRVDEIAETPNSSLRIETTWNPEAGPELMAAGANSPRTKVAARLQDLDLRHAAHVPLPASQPSSSQSPRKRHKRNLGIRDERVEGFNGQALFTPPQRERPVEIPDSASMLESPFEPSLPNVDEAMLDMSALTWQDNEITGHELDATSPDDDGEGINGIGFRPTPAMAYARSQKRKQQVEGWRAREAREARQRRIERRRGGSSSDPVAGEPVRRVVRFSEEAANSESASSKPQLEQSLET